LAARATAIHHLVGDVHRQVAHIAAHQAAHDDRAEPAGSEAVDATTVTDAHGQDVAHAHVHCRDEPSLPERALDGSQGAHRLERATQAPVELCQVLRQLDIGRHRDGQDIGFDIPRVAGLDVQAHAAIALVSWLGDPVGVGRVRAGRWLRVYLTSLRGGGRVAGASDL
jgi:hypothetical protein